MQVKEKEEISRGIKAQVSNDLVPECLLCTELDDTLAILYIHVYQNNLRCRSLPPRQN